MAPATRRSSGFGSHANSPSNLDHILEHFNQFKRKHITQNRDIIKTNALAQLRIKELEEKVLGLEAEKTQIELERHRMKARLERAEKAVVCIRQGWQLIGAGMTAVASIDGFENVTEQQAGVTPSSALLALQQHQQKSHIRPSVRVVLDPNALPGGVARNVARPPEADLADLAEEESMEMEEEYRAENEYISGAEYEQQGQITLEEPDIVDDGDSDNGEMGDPVSFAGDGEDTVRLQTDVNETVSQIHEEMLRHEDDVSNLDTEQQSNFHLHPPSSSNGQRNREIQRMTSMDSLSSFADDEEIELSTDDESGQTSMPNRAPTPVNNGSIRSQNGTARTKTPRKRKIPSSPEDARGPLSSISASSSTTDLHQQDTISASQSEAEMDEDDYDENSSNSSNGIRASRRSSMRDRKSVNYALPKLNTKMRKPDPVDLIPAIGSQGKKRQGSMQGGLNGDGMSEMNGENSEQEDEPKRRLLKGKNGAASTGNLREIRKLHQEKAQNDESLSPNREQEKQEEQSGLESANHRTSNEEQQTDSPRRRSSRQSLRRRSSSSMTSENGGTGNANNATNSDEGRSQRGGSSSPEERKVVQRKDNQAEYTLPGMQKPRQSASKLSSSTNGTSTPKWRSMSGGMSSASSHSLGPSGSGTPIPKPTIRAGQQGTIKALNKAAGRIQKPSTSISGFSNNGISNGNGNPTQQQKRVAAPFSNGGRAPSDTQTHTRILGTSTKANSTARSVSGSSTASSSSASSSVTGPSSQSTAGDPTKRNSLHAAMTWHDIPSVSQQN